VKRLFLSISKGEELRFLGHLDMLRTMERAVIRSGIPIAFSEGFNPHMKIAFDAALGVGVTADPLYLEMKLEKDFLPEKVSALLTPQLPKGVMLHEIKEVGLDGGKLVTFLNEDVYEMEGPVDGGKDILQTEKNIAEFNALDSFIYERVTPKRVRQMDVKPMIIQPMRVKIQGNRAYLKFSLNRINIPATTIDEKLPVIANPLSFVLSGINNKNLLSFFSDIFANFPSELQVMNI
jgi:radical SAM-linked protein